MSTIETTEIDSRILTERASKSSPSIYRLMSLIYQDMASKGLDVINFTIGDPTQPVYTPTVLAGIDHLRSHLGKAAVYTSFQGDIDMRDELSGVMNKQLGITSNKNNFVLTVGANDAIRQTLHLLASMKEYVVLHDPGFNSYDAMLIEDRRKVFKFSTIDDGYKIDFKPGGKLDRALEELYQREAAPQGIKRENFKFTFLFTDPGNPSGYKHSDRELEEARDLFTSKWKSAVVIHDGLYIQLSHDRSRTKSLLDVCKGTEFENRIVLIDSMSKVDSLAQERCGFALSLNPDFATKVANAQLLGTVHPAGASQRMLVESIKNRPHYVEENAAAYAAKTQLMYDELSPTGLMKYKPNAAFYTIADLSFMHDVPVSEATRSKYKEFYPDREEVPTTVGGSPILAAFELAQRTGVVTVPILKVSGKGIRYFSEDAEMPEYASVRMVPTLSPEALKDAAERMNSYAAEVKKGNVDYKMEIPMKDNTAKTPASKVEKQILCTPTAVEGITPKPATINR